MSEHQDCLFCNIVRGNIPCASVYETDDFLAFLDINPVHEGHVLIIPKRHATTLFDMPAEQGCALMEAMQKVGNAIMRATGANGLNVIQNNYPAAGQEVGHVHWHLIPRFEGDGYKGWPQKQYTSKEAMQEMATRIQQSFL